MIAALSLQGFKSFAGKVRLEFDGGICAVIGPNGSGKSNLVEAIRWVTHGARARELRAARGRELIFHGAGGLAPLGLAEVILELRASPARPRLNLARRVYAGGDGEQDVMGRPARAREVQGALRGTGLGPGGLAVIGQGEVSGVVHADGATLLGYLEEAAGLSGGRHMRGETRAQLHAAEVSLEGARLLEEERAARACTLRREADAAQAARALRARELALEDTLARARRRGLMGEIAQLCARVAELRTQSAAVAGRLTEAQSAQAAAREALGALRAQVAARAALHSALSAADGAARQAASYLDHLRAEESRLSAELASLGMTALDVVAPTPGPPPDLNALRAQLDAHGRAAEALEREVRVDELQLTRLRAEHVRRQDARARAETARDTLQSELVRAEAALAAAETARHAAQALQAEAQLATAAAERASAAHDLERSHSGAREVTARLQAVLAASGPLTRERDHLARLTASFARYGEGARNALRAGEDGVMGAVADVLTVPPEFELAVTAALGRRLEQVVVRDTEVARQVIERLKREGGRATFLPLDLLRVRPRRAGAFLRAAGVLGNLADLCFSQPGVVAEALLGDTLLLRDLRAAAQLARAHAARPRLVTPEGELIEPGGALSGGQPRDAGANHLADARRLTELDTELRGLQLERDDLTAKAARHGAEARVLEGRLATSAALQRAATSAAREAARAQDAAEATVQAARTRRDELHSQLHSRLHGRLHHQPRGAPETAPGGEAADLPAAEARHARRQGELHARRADERAAQHALSEARELVRAHEAARAARSRAAQLEARRAVLTAQLADQAALAKEAQLEARRRRTAWEEQAGLDDALSATERQLAEWTGIHTSLARRQNELRATLEETRLTLARREALLEDVPPGAELPGDARGWPAELARVRGERARLGPVNDRAEAEYARAEAELSALARERQDAEDAASELRAALAALEREAGAQLGDAHARVRRAYGEYVRELLGGVGELEAAYDEAGLPCGLQLSVQPGGKRTRAMHLLSAGERTMAGLAFLFALGHAAEDRGLALAVLDEVDAPLDEANIRRFTHFLTRFAARGTQFILVTHQKATMEVADALWGVTTGGDGASRALSIRRAGEVTS